MANGLDAILSTYGAGPNLPHDHDNPSASTVQYLRRASKNIFYTVVGSLMYEDGVTASSMDGWVTILIGAGVSFCLHLARRPDRRQNKQAPVRLYPDRSLSAS